MNAFLHISERSLYVILDTVIQPTVPPGGGGNNGNPPPAAGAARGRGAEASESFFFWNRSNMENTHDTTHSNEWMTHADIDGDGLAFFEGKIEGRPSRLLAHFLALLQEFEVILIVGMNKNCIG